MTYPSNHADAIEADYQRAFAKLAVQNVRFLKIASRDDAQSQAAEEAAHWATGVFLTGGSQWTIMGWIRGSRFEAAVRRRCADEVLVMGGTSAGAVLMSETMLSTGTSDDDPHAGDIELDPGLGLIRGVIIDSHFAQRGRLGRLLAAISEHPGELGLGLGEDTAIVVDGDQFEVIGKGVVTVIDPGKLEHNNRPKLDPGDAIALVGVTLHTLPAGYRYDLRTRTVINEPASGGRR